MKKKQHQDLSSLPSPQNDDFTRISLALQGQFRIQEVTLLCFSWLRFILFLPFVIVSIFGPFLLIYFVKLRVLLFYDKVNQKQASHVFITTTDGIQAIETMKPVTHHKKKVFIFKALQYKLQSATSVVPISYNYLANYEQFSQPKYIEQGLNHQDRIRNEQKYGLNEHTVEIPSYFRYLFQVMTQPFFILQYVVSIGFILQSLAVFAILMIVASFITTSINYVLLYIAFSKIKEMAQNYFQVEVIREGRKTKVLSNKLIPGDIYCPVNKIPCDSILLRGQLYLNQATLTGQSTPIGKFHLENKKQLYQSNRWLYEGSQVVVKRDGVLAIAIQTGYRSKRGQIIRKILTRIEKSPEFFRTLIYFLLETLLIGTVLYFATLGLLLSIQIDTQMVIFRYFDFLTYSFPPPFPIFFNVAYTCCLIRLKRKGIYGTQAAKTVQSLNLETMCFDKTGTLTENKMQVVGVYRFEQQKLTKCQQQIFKPTNKVKKEASEDSFEFIRQIMASCHTVQQVEGQLLGDQIDLKMFKHSGYSLLGKRQSDRVLFSVYCQSQKIDVLRINQYESKFQSMSVLIRNSEGRKFIFAKGAPQKLHKCSKRKFRYFDQIVKDFSLGGYRSIAIGYRQVQESELQKVMAMPREQLLKDILLEGIVTFENNLKQDTKDTLQKLNDAGIGAKIITGDNIFIAVETATRAKILRNFTKVLVLEGKNQVRQKFDRQKYLGTLLERRQHQLNEVQYELNLHVQSHNLPYHLAIDNDFLQMGPQTTLLNKVQVFARISPQNKASIVKTLKKTFDDSYQQRSRLSKIFGPLRSKVGMVGDGANDLIAIKEADVGIGFCDTDASYSASFTIKNLAQISQLVRESKNVASQIIQMARYYGLTNFVKIGVTILLTPDATYFTSAQMIFYNFTSTLLITNLMALSSPTTEMTKSKPCQNFMGLQNHLVYWGHTVIYTAGIIISYYVYQNGQDYQPNPHPEVTFGNGYFGETKSSTVGWLCILWSFTAVPFVIYQSSPWKEKIYRNYIMFTVIILNALALVTFYFITSELSIFNLVEIDQSEGAKILGIMAATVLISFMFQEVVNCLKLQSNSQFSNINTDSSSAIFGGGQTGNLTLIKP